jgi:hypothetical protein
LFDLAQRLQRCDHGFKWWCPATAAWDMSDHPRLKVLKDDDNDLKPVALSVAWSPDESMVTWWLAEEVGAQAFELGMLPRESAGTVLKAHASAR